MRFLKIFVLTCSGEANKRNISFCDSQTLFEHDMLQYDNMHVTTYMAGWQNLTAFRREQKWQ